MSLLDDLYQDVILDHYRNPRKRGALPEPQVVQDGVNPGCGDEVTVYLAIEDGALRVRFEGEGCAISQAAASLMASKLDGSPVAAAHVLAKAFQNMIRGGEVADELGDLSALAGVAKLPARVKCATLPFKTLEAALARLESAN